VKVPGSELARVLLADSLRGANWPGSEKAVNPKGDIYKLSFLPHYRQLDDFDPIH